MSVRQIWATGFEESTASAAKQSARVSPTSRPPELHLLKDERWLLVCRIAESSQFSRCPQLRGFLLFIASRALAGQAKDVNEHEIARSVLGRSKDFNPQEDNIVRVQARHLRAKLSTYFETAGSCETLIVTIPKGGYLPAFEPRPSSDLTFSTVETPLMLEHAGFPDASPPAQEAYPLRSGRSRWLTSCVLALAALLVIGVAAFLGRAANANALSASAEKNPLLTRAFPAGGNNIIVTTDACLTVVQDLFHQRLTLEEYLQGPDAAPQTQNGTGINQAFSRDCSRGFVSSDDIDAADALLNTGVSRNSMTTIRHPRHLNIRDFESGNFTLVGDPLANPWYELWASNLNFVFEADSSGARIVNRLPEKGEAAFYSSGAGTDRTEFATISMVPNLRENGSVLLLAGTGVEAVKAITETVTRNQLPPAFARIARDARETDSSLEILVQVHVVAGVSRDCEVLSYRVRRSLSASGRHNVNY